MQSAKESTLEDDPSASCISPSSEDLFSNQDVTDVHKDNIGERRPMPRSLKVKTMQQVSSPILYALNRYILQHTPEACPTGLSSFVVIL